MFDGISRVSRLHRHQTRSTAAVFGHLSVLGASVSLVTINLEVQWYWWVLSLTASVLTAFLIIGLIAHAALAHYLKTGYLVGITWSFALMLITLHVVYAVDYARASLAFPLLLCVVSGTLLTASTLPYHGRWIIRA